ncbi:HTH-like domain-containing protein [Arthrobacter alpinus]|uniref:HTH-like domain-containing protein n=1 Tax=Arthrobacter alpinus TaxID=656366 RepID=A0A1H5PGD0_9MICC|nr:IS3 family transposase [Arthrobacter alpinus]SEF12810.1 HTH-like domain-containing protein [Arthrobacter alpinus]
MLDLKAYHPLKLLLEVAQLPRSAFFYHQTARRRPDPQAELRERITEILTQARIRYGHRRVHVVLVRQGWHVAKKTVLKLMRAEKLICKVLSRRRYIYCKGQVGKIAENHLKREFSAPAPNTKWVTDASLAVSVRMMLLVSRPDSSVRSLVMAVRLIGDC